MVRVRGLDMFGFAAISSDHVRTGGVSPPRIDFLNSLGSFNRPRPLLPRRPSRVDGELVARVFKQQESIIV